MEITQQESSQEQKIKEIVEQLNKLQEQDLKENGYTNSCFFNNGSLTESHKFNFKEKKKYFYIDEGTAGVFMIDKATGDIFRIKAYSQINLSKGCGNIARINSEELFKLRWW